MDYVYISKSEWCYYKMLSWLPLTQGGIAPPREVTNKWKRYFKNTELYLEGRSFHAYCRLLPSETHCNPEVYNSVVRVLFLHGDFAKAECKLQPRKEMLKYGQVTSKCSLSGTVSDSSTLRIWMKLMGVGKGVSKGLSSVFEADNEPVFSV